MPERPPDPDLQRSTNRWMVAGLVIMVLMVLAFPAYRLVEPSNRDKAQEEQLASLAAQGEDLFALSCASCHGEQGLGGFAPSLNSKQFLESSTDEQTATLIAVGIPGSQMAAYSLDYGGPLTSEQIEAIAVYLRSLEDTAPDFPNWRDPQGNGE